MSYIVKPIDILNVDGSFVCQLVNFGHNVQFGDAFLFEKLTDENQNTYLIISWDDVNEIMVNVTSLRKVNVFKFVGTLKKVKFKKAQAMTAFHKFKNILCYISLSTGVRKIS